MRKEATTKKAEKAAKKAAAKKESKLVKLARIAKELSEVPISEDDHISISEKNRKMGPIPSISFPSGFTCDPNVPCWPKCYASNIENKYDDTIKAYWRNYRIYKQDPARFWRELEARIMMSRFFRSGVSGDFPDIDYLRGLKICCNLRGCDQATLSLLQFNQATLSLHVANQAALTQWKRRSCKVPMWLCHGCQVFAKLVAKIVSI